MFRWPCVSSRSGSVGWSRVRSKNECGCALPHRALRSWHCGDGHAFTRRYSRSCLGRLVLVKGPFCGVDATPAAISSRTLAAVWGKGGEILRITKAGTEFEAQGNAGVPPQRSRLRQDRRQGQDGKKMYRMCSRRRKRKNAGQRIETIRKYIRVFLDPFYPRPALFFLVLLLERHPPAHLAPYLNLVKPVTLEV